MNFQLELTKFSEDKVGNYSCVAENSLGKDSVRVYVDICSPDDDPECTSFAIMGRNINNVLLMSSLMVFAVKFLKF